MTAKQQNEIAKTIKDAVRTGIASVLAGKAKTFEIEPFKPNTLSIAPAVVKDIMTGLGWKAIERDEEGCGSGFDTNGWQYDWWMPFKKDGKKFTASGSGYYGGFTFGPTDE